jgi:hypothetical protein
MRVVGRHPVTGRIVVFALGVGSTTLAASPAAADPYRIRTDAIGITNAPQSPVGLLVLQGEDKLHPLVSAEALVWTGTGKDQAADALVVLVKLKDPSKISELRLGRQLIATGAIRPIHMDGADARATLPTGSSVEAFGGVPVAPAAGWNAYDWVAGGRAGQSLARDTAMGVSYLQRRERGQLSTEEVGFDLASAPTTWFDLASRGAYDLVSPGLAEGSVSLAARSETLRPELYAMHRSPSHLLPATSLFSALGDIPSNTLGASLRWRAFPRLDFLPTAAVRWVGADPGFDGTLKTTLRLDDLGAGALMLDLRRQDIAPDRWTGVRGAARVPLSRFFVASTELELAVPDDPRGRGSVWPWGLVALRWMPVHGWEAAGAVEAASTPKSTGSVNALLRLSYYTGSP